MKIIKQLFTPLAILALTTTLSFATIYSNGEDGTTGAWRVHDNKPSGATISNVIDEAKNSKVIEFRGAKRLNAYIIGAKKGEKAWNNSQETKLRWSMNFNEKYKIVVYVQTSKGKRIFFYNYKNRNKGLYKNKYIGIGLGKKTSQGDWVNIERDLKADLKKYDPDNTLLKVNGFKVKGSGKIDNLELYKADASADLKIHNIHFEKKSDTYVKIYWELNHKGTGQVEYGMTTDYETFTKKENSFKYDSHGQSLRGLEPNTTYHYRVISEDEAGHRVVSEDKTFSTTGNVLPCITLRELKAKIKKNEDVTKVNTSCITDMSGLFYGNKTFNQDISNWDVSNVTNMKGMFRNAKTFNQPLDNWDTSNVTDMQGMFSYASKFNQDISKWNISNVKSISHLNFTDFLLEHTSFSEKNYKKLYDSWIKQDISEDVQDYLKRILYRLYPSKIPAKISSLQIKKITDHSVEISWKLSHNGTGQIEYGETTSYGSFTKKEESFKYKEHSQNIRNLIPNKTYHYRIISVDKVGNRDVTKDSTFFVSGAVVPPNSDKNAFITTWSIKNKYRKSHSSDGGEVYYTDAYIYKDKELRISTNKDYHYDFNIDWGDGFINKNVTKTIIHKYKNEGLYTVSITGKYPKLEKLCIKDIPTESETYFLSEMQNLISVNQWGTQKWKSMNRAFYHCEELSSMDRIAPDLSEVSDAKYMFRSAYKFNQPIGNWDVSSITNMDRMFYSPSSQHSNYEEDMVTPPEEYSVFNQDISNWNVSNVTNMEGMLNYTALSTKNYDNILQAWSQLALQKDVVFGENIYFLPERLTYSQKGKSFRQKLIDVFGWKIEGDVLTIIDDK